MTADLHVGAEIRHRIGATGRFVLRGAAGEIRITATDTDTAVVRDRDGEDLSRTFEIGTRDGELELVARQGFGFSIAIGDRRWGNSADNELDIELPARATLVLDVASADVEASGLLGPKKVRTASGDVRLHATGGDLELEVVSGDVTIDAVAALDVRGKTISGDVRVRAPRLTRFDMSTTSGDLWIDGALGGKGPFSVRSISGDVLLMARGDVQVEAQTITGDLSSQVAHRRESMPGRKVLQIGRAGGPTFAFKSVSGDLQIAEPREQQVTETMTDDDTTTATPNDTTAGDDARLEILRALERGDIDVETATERLAALEVA
jgi:putative adhesin